MGYYLQPGDRVRVAATWVEGCAVGDVGTVVGTERGVGGMLRYVVRLDPPEALRAVAFYLNEIRPVNGPA